MSNKKATRLLNVFTKKNDKNNIKKTEAHTKFSKTLFNCYQ